MIRGVIPVGVTLVVVIIVFIIDVTYLVMLLLLLLCARRKHVVFSCVCDFVLFYFILFIYLFFGGCYHDNS